MDYWRSLDELVKTHELIIDRPMGSNHPRFPRVTYPLNYGHLKGTKSGDREGIDVWQGSRDSKTVDATIIAVDLLKSDVEVKLLVGCTNAEIEIVLNFHNMFSQSGILVKRGG